MTAYDSQSLFDKSKVFIGRAIDCDEKGEDDAFHLWAALSLELLGKAALSEVHPALIADPLDVGSIFAACGKPISTHRKSILAKTVFERLTHLSKNYLEKEKLFCLELTHRRNAELHSGELPCVGLRRDSWVPKFWRVSVIILEMQNRELSDWLGKDRSEAAIEEMRTADLLERVNFSIERHKKLFKRKYPNTNSRSKAKRESLNRLYLEHRLFDDTESETFVEVKCPSCKCYAALGGKEWFSEATGRYDDDEPWMELVEVTYATLGFDCPQCELKLNGREELDLAGFPDDFVITETREMDVEPDYGND